mmetsp:Transcript_57024/g.128208  ORF Transcript_57024/g.128208 Transcript_57024/m.128208 type:complete len:162 (-) Transcript_57024:63-548(-)
MTARAACTALCHAGRRRSCTASSLPAAVVRLMQGVSLRASPSIYSASPSSTYFVSLQARSLSGASSSGLSAGDLEQRLGLFNDQFAEARLCLQDAMESKDTTYFKDDILDAKEAVEKTMEIYNGLLGDLSEEQRRQVDDANGLKVKSLQEEYDQLIMEDDH